MERIMTTFRISAVALGMASALALTAIPATAGPLMPNQAAVKAAAPDQGTDVQWRGRRGHHRGWGPGIGIGAGIAAGALIGSAVAAQPYYGGGYYYEEPVYGPGYGAPVYAQPYGYDTPYYAPVAPSRGYGYRGGNYCEEGYRRVQCSQGGGY
jgi:hypothetical protein